RKRSAAVVHRGIQRERYFSADRYHRRLVQAGGFRSRKRGQDFASAARRPGTPSRPRRGDLTSAAANKERRFTNRRQAATAVCKPPLLGASNFATTYVGSNGWPPMTELRFFNPYAAIRLTENRLPHWQQEGAVYFVTFRLGD